MIQVRNVSKRFEAAGPSAASIQALSGVDLDIARGEAVALMGASGSGKSTLLHLIGGLDAPSSGEVLVEGRSLGTLDDAELSKFRRTRVGFIFQFFHLLPTLSVLEIVLLSARLAGLPDAQTRPRAVQLLERVGLAARSRDNPDILSGGEQQRVALARALINQPVLLLADEPTGNLDSASSASVLALISELIREHNTTLVMATHSEEAAKIAHRIVRLKDGRVC
jgi:putative ABC transport system ATP-binding protein